MHVAHPAATGSLTAVEASYVSSVERRVAAATGMPIEGWTDTARLVRLDGDAVCFDVTTRLVEAGGTGELITYLTIAPETTTLRYDGGTLESPTIMPRGAGGSTSTVAVEDTRVHPDGITYVEGTHDVRVDDREGGGIVCFMHRGAITPGNQSLSLTYQQSDFRPRFDFTLDASPRPTAWPAGPIVAPGYDYLR